MTFCTSTLEFNENQLSDNEFECSAEILKLQVLTSKLNDLVKDLG